MDLPVKNIQGEEVRRQQVSESLFGKPMNQSLLHQAMVTHQANQRQGTSSTKTRAQVSGGGSKPRPQKHSGRSRQGTRRSPLWRHGGVVFGPTPRSYRRRLPKKMRRLAILCALSDKVRENRLTLVDGFSLDEPKTREMAHVLRNLGVGSSALVVLGAAEINTVRTARNLREIKTLPPDLLNVLDLLRYDHVVMDVEALPRLEGMWASSKEMISDERAQETEPSITRRTTAVKGKAK